MRRFGLCFGLLISLPAMSFVTLHKPSLLEQAREKRLISSQSLIVKLKLEHVSELAPFGEFRPFLHTPEGVWGTLNLHMLPDGESAALILGDLSKIPHVIHAYYSPLSKNANVEEISPRETQETQPGDYESKQHYLMDPPMGVGARSAWNIPGGTGEDVKIIDLEVCWSDRHIDFQTPFFIGANPTCASTNHGTAVWGEIAAKNDGVGVTGIAHGADFGIYGFAEGDWSEVNDQYIESSNRAIQGSVDQLDEGDVIVIEQQMVGPDLQKYTAVEYWPHIYEQLKMATEKGIICVEAAGNGTSNFDDPIYKGAFDLKVRDSGCIMVGAVGHGNFERLPFSNYGSRVDASGYGSNVVTTGFGDLYNDGKDNLYTARFNGTSSATPIVAGAVAVVSSIAKENGRIITPKEMREALRKSGIPQGPNTSALNVGNFPVIKQLLKQLKISSR